MVATGVIFGLAVGVTKAIGEPLQPEKETVKITVKIILTIISEGFLLITHFSYSRLHHVSI